jgi:hypothetical protein
MVKAERLKAEIIEANKEAAELPHSLVELDVSGRVVSAFDHEGNLLSKKDAFVLAEKVQGEGERVVKTFTDYEGQSRYDTVIKFKVEHI